MRNPDFDFNKIDYNDSRSEKYRSDIIIKHERRVNVIKLENFLSQSLRIAEYLNDSLLSSKIKKYVENVWTERPPMPKSIPDYIEHWSNQKDQSWRKGVSTSVTAIFSEN